MRTIGVAVTVCFTLLVGVAKAESKRAWQDGIWRDTERTRTLGGVMFNGSGTSVATGPTRTGTAGGSAIPVYRVTHTFLIETADRWYVATQRLRFRWSKPVPMTVNAPVRFAVEKDKVVVIGEDDKEYELNIEQKGLKTAPQR